MMRRLACFLLVGAATFVAAVGASCAPAGADWKPLREDRVIDGWKIRFSQEDRTKVKSCQIISPAVSGGYYVAMSMTQRSPPDPNAFDANFWLGNATWQLAPDAKGQATVALNNLPRTLNFQRIGPTEMWTALPATQEDNGWLLNFVLGDVVVTLPNGETFTIPDPSDDVANSYLTDCVLPIATDEPSRDPFAPTPPANPKP